MPHDRLRVLCLDIEGGYGGSSRSLYISLKNVDRRLIAPTVLCRREGPIQARYEALDIPTQAINDLPRASALPRTSRNLWQLAQHTGEFAKAWHSRTLNRLLEAARSHDLIHFNHEAFASLAWWLKPRAMRPQTMHIRTNVAPTLFARWQMRIISQSVDAIVYITANEQRTFRTLGGTAPGRVIFNIVESSSESSPHPLIPRDSRFVVASLSNAAYVRGTDRLLDIAASLRQRGRTDVLIVCAGSMKLAGSWPGDLADIAKRGGTLEDAAKARSIDDMFLFLGHVPDPERVLAASHVLIKPTREDNPWGRDILEAMAAGTPVVSIGRDSTFVEDGLTGVLQASYDAGAFATAIANLADDRLKLAALGAAARDRVAHLCNGPDRARDLTRFWWEAANRQLPKEAFVEHVVWDCPFPS